MVVRSDPCEISRSVHLGPWVGFNILPVELIILFVLLCNPGVITGGLAPLPLQAAPTARGGVTCPSHR